MLGDIFIFREVLANMGTQTLTVITNRNGTVIGATVTGQTEDGFTVSITPLEGQRIHEVEVPESLDASSHDEMLRGVLGWRISGDGSLTPGEG
ncbi:hypothetical protein [Streptomyces sp. NRRL S-646]|uniref:hypothetical protein n=1 Tax=Streptomyces sp. NRRL S-646 TaxID=1463917 RepID=UPI00133118F1|nr:hypothetical protein [Streptomyces sp. NRRL S-646]